MNYVVVGKLGSAHGIQGWLKFHSFTEPLVNALCYKPWYLKDSTTDSWKLINLKASNKHSKGFIVKLEGYDNPEQARLLTGKPIAVLRSQLPPLKKGEFYWADLEGLTVINAQGTVLGKVVYLFETGSNDVLVVKGDKEYAIPYLTDVIKNIDLLHQVIHVDWEWT